MKAPRGLAVIVSPCLLVVAILALSGGAALVTGQQLLWPPLDLNPSEAIVRRDQAEMARQILSGVDPNARYDVVDAVRAGEHYQLTPLEAAITTRELYMVELVVGYGGVVDRNNAPALACLARAMHAEDIENYLTRIAAVESCDGVPLPLR